MNNPEKDDESLDDPLTQTCFFQELPPDMQLVVLQGVKFRVSKDSVPDNLGLFDLDDLLDEEADDFINRHNWKITIKAWLKFAETGR